jgi:hypothetical protein
VKRGFLTLRKGHTWRLFEEKLLRKTFEPKRKKERKKERKKAS